MLIPTPHPGQHVWSLFGHWNLTACASTPVIEGCLPPDFGTKEPNAKKRRRRIVGGGSVGASGNAKPRGRRSHNGCYRGPLLGPLTRQSYIGSIREPIAPMPRNC